MTIPHAVIYLCIYWLFSSLTLHASSGEARQPLGFFEPPFVHPASIEMFGGDISDRHPNVMAFDLDEAQTSNQIAGTPPPETGTTVKTTSGPEEKHLTFKENQKGVSYEKLFADYLKGAKQITITDPYIRLFYQTRNLMELLELVVRHKAADDEITVDLLTTEDEFRGDQQRESFDKIKASCEAAGIKFNWKFDSEGTIHARHIVTDNGWKISLDRGLDIFQHYDMNDTFTLANRLQEQRQCKAFEVTYIKA